MLHIVCAHGPNCATKLEKSSGVLLHPTTSTVQWIEPVFDYTISKDTTSLSDLPQQALEGLGMAMQ